MHGVQHFLLAGPLLLGGEADLNAGGAGLGGDVAVSGDDGAGPGGGNVAVERDLFGGCRCRPVAEGILGGGADDRLGRVMVPIWPAEKRLEGMGSLLCITLKILKPSVAGQQRTLHYIEPTRKTQGPSRGFSLIGSKHSPCCSPGRKNTRRWAGSSGPRPRRPCDMSPPTTVRPPPRLAEIAQPPPASRLPGR